MAFAHRRRKPTSNREYGELVGREERTGPYSAEEVQDWLDGNLAPAFSTLMAIGRLAGQDQPNKLGYLAFGNDLLIHELTAEEYGLVYRRQKIAPANAKAL